MMRIEKTGIRIWELLESEGEMSLEQIKRRLHVKTPITVIEEAIQWLLANDYVLVRESPAGRFFRADGTPPPPR